MTYRRHTCLLQNVKQCRDHRSVATDQGTIGTMDEDQIQTLCARNDIVNGCGKGESGKGWIIATSHHPNDQ